MSKGGTIPYNLRLHKAVERNLFVDLLHKINAFTEINLSDYGYIGFGAASLEDFKLIHLEFSIKNMYSIEGSENPYSRQKFNNPYEFIKLNRCLSSDFLNYHFPEQDNSNFIVWLDYTDPHALRDQFLEAEILGMQSSKYDIIKFTFNSNIDTHLHKVKGKHLTDKLENLIQVFKSDEVFKLYVPPQLNIKNVLPIDRVIRSMAIRAFK